MTPDPQFDSDNLARAEAILLDDEIGRRYFQGELYDRDGKRLIDMTLRRHGGTPLKLDEKTIGRLFMIPDGSIVRAREIGEKADAPAGWAVQSSNILLATDEQSNVIAFHDTFNVAMCIEALHVQRFILANYAPEHLGTVAFGLMAINAYRLGFAYITLFAAGRGPLKPREIDTFVGFNVWPKFGFDAPVTSVELNRCFLAELNGAQTVQDVIAVAPHWWSAYGTGRTMRFDLTAKSRNWAILLHYLYEALVERKS